MKIRTASDRRLYLHYGDLSTGEQLSNLIYNMQPDEIYHLGAQSHVRVSFDVPEFTGDITALGTTRILEAVRNSGITCRFYQAGSSEMFGSAAPPQNENTAFHPRSPYGAAKSIRPLDDGELSGSVWDVCSERNSLQP